MGYATILEVEQIIGQALTSARPDTPGERFNLLEIGHTRDSNRIPDDIVNYYISLGDNQIDGILSQQYYTPLKLIVLGQWSLDSDISEYNQQIETSEANSLVPGDQVLIKNMVTGYEESHFVSGIVDYHTVTSLDPMSNFDASNSVVKRILYPPPINQISARYAASFIYDKYFTAQNSPNISDYGKEMRNVAMGQLNDILNGKVILRNQLRIGDRFGNPWLDSSYAHRTPVDGYNTSDRDMSKMG